MARRLDVVDRGKPFSDEGCRYQWSWHWLDADFVVFDDDGNEIKCRYGEFYRKLTAADKAHCTLCDKEIAYANKGFISLKIFLSLKHLQLSLRNEKKKKISSGGRCPPGPPTGALPHDPARA